MEGQKEGGREAVIEGKAFACSVFLIDDILTSTSAVPHCERSFTKLPALVYDILPSTTALFSYAIGSTKLSANKQFFVNTQTVVSLLQTTQIKQGVSFIAAIKVYTSTNKTTIV